jgi:hypothetical protein
MQSCAVEFLLQTQNDDHCESQEELELGSSTKDVALQGRCDKAHCHGTGFSSVPSSSVFYVKSHPSMLQKKTVCHTRVLEESNHNDLPLRFSDPHTFFFF